MANVLYPSFKAALLTADIDVAVDDIRAILVDTAEYTYSAAHDFLDDVPAASREEVSSALASKTTTGGVFDAADVTWTAASGDPCEAIILYQHTGTESTSRLICYIDTGTGLPVTLNGGNVVSQWNASGIFAL